MTQPQEDKKEFLTLQEAAEIIGIKRPSLYYYLKGLNITIHKFPFNRYAYLAASDVQRIKDIKDRPWILEDKIERKKPGNPISKKEETYAKS